MRVDSDDDAIGIAHPLRVAHTVGVNGFFTAPSHSADSPVPVDD